MEISVRSEAGTTYRDCGNVVASCTMPPTPECPLAAYGLSGGAIDAAAMFLDRNLILKDFTWRNYRGEMIPRFSRVSALDFSNTTTEDDKT